LSLLAKPEVDHRPAVHAYAATSTLAINPNLGAGPTGTELRFLDFVTGGIRVIADFGRHGNPNVAISSDGRWALYSRSEQSNTNLILVENFR
jgi:hypothetical protein